MGDARSLKNLIDEKGIPLYGPCPLYEDEETSGFPAFEAHTRSSLMGFMLNEVFAQAVSQINSWLYRSRKKDRTLPRYLRAVIDRAAQHATSRARHFQQRAVP